jgi:hypothetical protein
MFLPRAEMGYLKLGDLPDASSEDKVEVWERSQDDGSSLLELVEYSWGSGIGWYVQKRITLDAGQVDALRALLGASPTAPARPRRPLPPVIQEDGAIRLLFRES